MDLPHACLPLANPIPNPLGSQLQEQIQAVGFKDLGGASPGSHFKLTRQASLSHEQVVLVLVVASIGSSPSKFL